MYLSHHSRDGRREQNEVDGLDISNLNQNNGIRMHLLLRGLLMKRRRDEAP